MFGLTKTDRKQTILYILIGIVAAAVLGVSIYAIAKPKPAASEIPERPEPETVVRQVQKIVEVEKEVSVETMEDGLRNMGFLVTQEYYFTDKLSFSSIKKLFKTDIELKFTESSYLATYDGTVTAGVDFTAVRVEKDEETVTVHIPRSEIQSVTIDPESFELYSEKNGLGNPLSVEDFNSSLVELENSAREKALERGLLTKADENAQTVIRNFITGLLGADSFRLRIVTD